MHGRSRDAHLKLRDPLLDITCALQQIEKHCCTTSMQQKLDSPAVPVGGVYEHGRLCSDGRHRREHTRERSDGQAQLAENRPNAGVPHTDALSAAYLRESGSSSSASKYALLMTKMAPTSSGPRPFPHQAAGISSASSRAGRFPQLDPWQTLRV